MNFFTAKPQAGNNFRPVQNRVSLPMSARLCVPAGLDWVIKQRLSSVIAYALIDDKKPASQRVTDLCRLDKVFSQTDRRDIHQVLLYGFELTTLYSFLLEQERHYSAWSPGLVPQRASHLIRAELRGILPKLHTLCLQVDVYADRPVHQR